MRYFFIITFIIWAWAGDDLYFMFRDERDNFYIAASIYIAVWLVIGFVSYVENQFEKINKSIDKK